MTEVEKTRKMINAFDDLWNEYRSEGKFDYADKVKAAALDLPNSSMARLYDILQKS